jgi:hypothetical protein
MDEHMPDAEHPNLYELLQVSPRANSEVIHAAYRVLARGYHPDVSHDPNGAHLMRALNTAHDVLSDPERRARYDAQCARSARVSGDQPSVAPRRRSRRRAPAAARLVEQGTLLPAVRVIFALVLVTLVAAIGLGLWLLYDIVQDRPPGALHTLDDGSAVAVHRSPASPLNVIISDSLLELSASGGSVHSHAAVSG